MLRIRRMTIAIGMSILLAVPGHAANIGDFLTGGANSGTQETDVSGTAFPSPADSTGAASGDISSQSLNVVTCTDDGTGINVARAMVPEGYHVESQTVWCGVCQSPDYPAEVFISAHSSDGSIQMTYESGLMFIEVQNVSANGVSYEVHQDGVINTDFLIFQLSYMTAPQYCDYVSQNLMEGASGMTFVYEKPLTQEEQAMLEQASRNAQEESDALLVPGSGMYTDFVETTCAERTYRYMDSYGQSKLLLVRTAVQGVRLVQKINTYGVGDVTFTYILWTIPARFCLMVDEDKYQEGLSVFEAFADNTTLSDQFKQTMKELGSQIVSAAIQAKATSLSEQKDYVQSTFSSTLSGKDDTYSAIDGWDDVIMDRNDYTLSNGDRVKVDTSYDYVYEMPDGNIYMTDSAMDEPAGGTRLYAN